MQENGGFLSFTQEGCRKELLFLLQTPPPHFLCMNDSLYGQQPKRQESGSAYLFTRGQQHFE